VFGRMPTLGLLANLLAVPVAGAVMLVGLPTAIVAAASPAWLAEVVMAPAELGTRWVAAVAHLIAALEPEGLRAVVVWAVQCWLIGLLVRERWRRRPPSVER
jgi:competence protein ComEC